MAIAVTILNRIEYAVFAVVYFLSEVPLLLGAVAVYRTWRTQAVQRTELPGAAR
jgi:ACR3 family arsenite efflux pump ArsB